MSKSDPVTFLDTHHVRDHCLCLAAQRAARALARRFDAALRPAQLTNGQFSLMMGLNRPEPPTLGAVASLLAMDRTTLTAASKPLERQGLVESVPDPKDRRSRILSLTDKGGQRLAEALVIWRREHAALDRELAEGIGDAEDRTLRRGLGVLAKGDRPDP